MNPTTQGVTGMIRGIGVDVTQISRIRRALKRTPSLAQRLYTDREVRDAEGRGAVGSLPWATYLASAFALKEAVAKALGTGFVHFGWADIETFRYESGQPGVGFSSKVIDLIDHPLGPIHVSLTSEGDLITAFCVLERGQEPH